MAAGPQELKFYTLYFQTFNHMFLRSFVKVLRFSYTGLCSRGGLGYLGQQDTWATPFNFVMSYVLIDLLQQPRSIHC